MPTEITGPIEHGVLAERRHYEGAVESSTNTGDFLDDALAEQPNEAEFQRLAVEVIAEATEIARAASAISANVVNSRHEHLKD